MKELSRILIVGLGSIGKRHLRIAKKLFPEVEVGVLRHRKVNGPVEDGVDHLFYTYDDAVSFKPDIAVIANPATHHLSIAQQLGEAGVNMLIEKPLAESSDGVSQLIKQCDRNKVKLAVGYNLRYLPSLNEFKNLIEKGIIGDIWSVKSEIGQYLPSWRPDSDYRHCVSAKKSLGGGVLLELSHELDYMQWVFGEPRWVLASLTKQSNLEIDVEDNAHIIMEMNDSLTNRSAVVTVNMDFIRHDTTRTCTVIGEFGTMRWDGIAGSVDLYSIENQRWDRLFEHKTARDDSYLAEWKDFIACIDTEHEPGVSGEDGLKVLKLIDAIRRSEELGARVSMGL